MMDKVIPITAAVVLAVIITTSVYLGNDSPKTKDYIGLTTDTILAEYGEPAEINALVEIGSIQRYVWVYDDISFIVQDDYIIGIKNN